MGGRGGVMGFEWSQECDVERVGGGMEGWEGVLKFN